MYFEISELSNKFNLLVTLLSYQSPFDLLDQLESEINKHMKNGNVILDEYAHNNSDEKRFISFEIVNGKVHRDTISFEVINSDDEVFNKANDVLIENKGILYKIGVDLHEL